MLSASYRSMVRIIQSIQSKVVRPAEVERVIMWVFEVLRPMRANVIAFLDLLLGECRVNGLGRCVHSNDFRGRHEYFLTVQPSANVHYEVCNLPIPIIEVELLQMTYVSIHRVKPISCLLYTSPSP